MKSFACGDVVPGCTEAWVADDDAAIFHLVAVHAQEVHGLDEVPPELAEKVRESIRDAD